MPRNIASQLPDGVNEVVENEIATTCLTTHNGQKLSPKEDRFISLYIKYADPLQAAKEAGYSIRETVKDKDAQYAKRGRQLLAKDYIQDEIAYRTEVFRDANIADAKEVMMYLTKVMRGEEKDQFGLDVSIADRTNAAKELNRRMHEIESSTNREGGKEVHLVLRRED
jgi:phage terminase small subunit